jgi:hypothetical protein
MSDQANNNQTAQLNARISADVKKNVKIEAARSVGPDGQQMTVDRVTETILKRFFLDYPTAPQRDQFWRANQALIPAPRRREVAAAAAA